MDLSLDLQTNLFGLRRIEIYKRNNLEELIDRSVYRKVLKTFYKILRKAIIETGYLYKLPIRTGAIGIVRRKQKKYSVGTVDWYNTNKNGKLTRYKTTHTFGWYARILWDKQSSTCVFKNRGLFRFKPTKEFKKELKTSIIDDNVLNKYYIVNSIYSKDSQHEK